ncbi:MAG: hypothetical protein RL217_1776 [Pseudomonadota bacterium]|jgi:general secretion pathway protein J
MSRGFTLLEVLIAVAITAMIGIGSVQLLSNIIETRRATDIRAEQLASLQRFNQVLGRDIEQIINRSIRDEFGSTQPALVLGGSDYLLEFTRTGWRNSPFVEEPRAELQRVAYRLEPLDSDACKQALKRLESWGITEPQGECLLRYFWPVLDRANNTEPIAQVLLEQAEGLEFDVLARVAQSESQPPSKGDWFNQWPAPNSTNGIKPQAVRMRITLPNLGEIERLWLISWGEF